VVSTCKVNDRKPEIRPLSSPRQAWQFRHGPAKPIQPAHHQGVTNPESADRPMSGRVKK
jgi:hypothetical protein